jgi:hypothetical protein
MPDALPNAQPNALANPLVDANQRVHDGLDELFLGALEALTELDLGRACLLWERFQTTLAEHAASEEALVLPVYARSEPFERGGAPELFEAEHRKLEQLAGDGRTTLAALAAGPAQGLRRRAILALDGLLRVRHLLEHHGLRERIHLYPRVAELADAAAQQAILAGLRTEESDRILLAPAGLAPAEPDGGP